MITNFHDIRAKINYNWTFSKFPEIFPENSVIPWNSRQEFFGMTDSRDSQWNSRWPCARPSVYRPLWMNEWINEWMNEWMNDNSADCNVCCLQSVISHKRKMSPSNVLVIALIITGVPAVISTYAHMIPGACFPDPSSCIRHIMRQPTALYNYTYFCTSRCVRRGLRTALCERIRDRCYTCICY